MILGMLFLAGSLIGQDQPAPRAPVATPSAPTPQPAPQRQRQICETRALTGRRLEQRICYTPEQHARLVAAKRREADEVLAGGSTLDEESRILGGH